MNSCSHGWDLSFTYKTIPGHFFRPFLSSWVPSHSPVKAQLREFPYLTQFLVFSINEYFHLLRYLDFLSVYFKAFKKMIYKCLDNFFSLSM